jgi:hypothetical protein
MASIDMTSSAVTLSQLESQPVGSGEHSPWSGGCGGLQELLVPAAGLELLDFRFAERLRQSAIR